MLKGNRSIKSLALGLLVTIALLAIPATALATRDGSSLAAVSFDCTAVAEIPQAECEALVSLYNSTGGPNWTNSTDWLVTNTPCTWFGVTCAGGHVSDLNLRGNQLTGSIPLELSGLASLLSLDLALNQLTGAIPPGLSGLASLQALNLSYNQLTGSIPSELGGLASLQELDLTYNQVAGSIPS